MDIGGIGEWGEMHLGLHIQGRWTPQQLEETGFTRDKYVAAYRRVIDAHAAAFPADSRVLERRFLRAKSTTMRRCAAAISAKTASRRTGPAPTWASCTITPIPAAA